MNPSSSNFLPSIITYKGSLLMDLFITFKSRMVFSNEGPRLDIIAMESMLDWSPYKEFKLVTELVSLLAGICSLLRFSPSTWVPQPLLFSFSPSKISSQVFIWGPRNGSSFVSMYQHRCAGHKPENLPEMCAAAAKPNHQTMAQIF